ncbi:peroxide stress protein YaaA [Egicoccus sp. AB-alg2]|uniref:peroxide stress protein YaaA n=1 Tax=Egicoccus sp. AB-alg2 TaxID=3242693 RepID=UPI00359E9058
MSAPLVLLPPSKGKAEGGEQPTYGEVVARDGGALGDARRQVLAAVLDDVDALDDAALARLAGVGTGRVADARKLLVGLPAAPTMPAHRRYRGVVHGNAGLAELDPEGAGADVRVVSALLGLAAMADPVPDYRLEVAARLPSLGGLGGWWRERVAEELARLGQGRRVWDLLPAEHARVWDAGVRRDLDVVSVRFVRPDGRAANAARTKVCKGRLTATLLAHPDLDAVGLTRRADPGAGWQLEASGADVTAICRI